MNRKGLKKKIFLYSS